MTIHGIWSKPIDLKDGKKQNLPFTIPTNLPEGPGCYIFFNQHGATMNILYVGKAKNLKKRIETQFNNAKLVTSVKNHGNGTKRLMYCEISLKQGQQLDKIISLVEKNLIKAALSEGHELLNIAGAKGKYGTIHFKSNKHSQRLFRRKMKFSL